MLWTPEDLSAEQIAALQRGAKKKKQTKGVPITKWAFALNDMKNSRGHVVMGDARSKGNGWGHHASAIPTAIGDFLYVPIMSGNVYVLRPDVKSLDENALVSVNDLGTIGQSWNRASISYSRGRLYAHTIGKLICIGE